MNIIGIALWVYACSVLVMLADCIVYISRLKRKDRLISSHLLLPLYSLLPVLNTAISLLIIADYWFMFIRKIEIKWKGYDDRNIERSQQAERTGRCL